MKKLEQPKGLKDLKIHLGELMDDGMYTITIHRYASIRPAPQPIPPPALNTMISSLHTLTNKTGNVQHQREAFDALACYLPYPEERLDFLRTLKLTPSLDTSIRREQVRTALDVVAPWLCWEPTTVEAIQKVMQDYLPDSVDLSFGVFGLEADKDHTRRIRDHRRNLRELLGDEGGAGRLEAFLRVVNAPRFVSI